MFIYEYKQRKSYYGWNTWNSRQIWLSVPLSGRENLTPIGTQGKRIYLCLAPNALVAKILLQLEYIEFKANVVTHVLLRTAVCSAQDALLRIVSIYEAGKIYAG